jgi:excisionase family DNA binding protein
MEKEWLKDQRLTVHVAEAAELLGLGRNSTYDLLRSGRLRSVRVGRRFVIPRSEIDAFLEREALGGK